MIRNGVGVGGAILLAVDMAFGPFVLAMAFALAFVRKMQFFRIGIREGCWVLTHVVLIIACSVLARLFRAGWSRLDWLARVDLRFVLPGLALTTRGHARRRQNGHCRRDIM